MQFSFDNRVLRVGLCGSMITEKDVDGFSCNCLGGYSSWDEEDVIRF